MTREEAIEILKDIRETDGTNHGIHAVALAMGIDALQAEPVKHGEWVPCTKNGLILSELIRAEDVAKWYGYKCSECNYIHKGNALVEYNYCPNCGAKMDKK